MEDARIFSSVQVKLNQKHFPLASPLKKKKQYDVLVLVWVYSENTAYLFYFK